MLSNEPKLNIVTNISHLNLANIFARNELCPETGAHVEGIHPQMICIALETEPEVQFWNHL